MNILVCISKTPDTTARITFTGNKTKYNEQGVQFVINPSDEWYALVRALELKETQGATVHLISVGGANYDPIIRKALALGGDEAIRVNAEDGDSFFVASQIAHVAKEGNYDLILTGKETIDYNGSAVGGMIAAILDQPYISLATQMDIEGTEATLKREIEGGVEVCSIQLPVVVSCMKGMAEQRIPNMRGIMAARKKPLKVVEPIDSENLTEITSFELPEQKTGVKLIDAEDVDELVRLLHEEAKVI